MTKKEHTKYRENIVKKKCNVIREEWHEEDQGKRKCAKNSSKAATIDNS